MPKAPLRLGLISNPLSGGNRKALSTIRKLLVGHQQVCHCEANTPSEVTSALDEFARSKVDIVAVNGGDGTAHAVLTGLFRQPPPGSFPLLALLRSGTASMLARDVGLRGSPRAAAKRLLRWIDTGSGTAAVVQRPLLKVTPSPEAAPLYGMFFGAAGICQGIRFCLDRVHTKGVSGQLAAGVTLARFLVAALRRDRDVLFPVPATVTLDGELPLRGEFSFILMSSLERLFLGLRPYWGNGTAPLYYSALAARPQHLLRVLPVLLRGRTSRFATPEHGYFSRKVREARLTFTGAFTLDGELYPPDNNETCVTVTEGGKVSFLRL